MILFRSSGLAIVDEVSEEAYTILVDTAEDMLAAGVRLSPEAFAALEPVERAALAEAGDRLRASLVIAVVDALTDRGARLALLGDADPERAEDEAIDVLLDDFVQGVFAR